MKGLMNVYQNDMPVQDSPGLIPFNIVIPEFNRYNINPGQNRVAMQTRSILFKEL